MADRRFYGMRFIDGDDVISVTRIIRKIEDDKYICYFPKKGSPTKIQSLAEQHAEPDDKSFTKVVGEKCSEGGKYTFYIS